MSQIKEAALIPKRNDFFEGFIPHTPKTEEYVARELLRIEVSPRIERGFKGEFQFRIDNDVFLHGLDERKLIARYQALGINSPEKGFKVGDLSNQHLIIVDHDLVIHNVEQEVVENRLHALNFENAAFLRIFITPDGKILEE